MGKEGARNTHVFGPTPWRRVMLFAEVEETPEEQEGTGSSTDSPTGLSVASPRAAFLLVSFLTIPITEEFLKGEEKMVSQTVPGFGEWHPVNMKVAMLGALCLSHEGSQSGLEEVPGVPAPAVPPGEGCLTSLVECEVRLEVSGLVLS